MLKRAFDLASACLLLLLMSPLLAVIGSLVWWKLGTPVLFRQVRPGRNGKPFELLKFRSMKDRRDENGQLLSDEQRLTRFGIWLRSTSLDELPELINVLRGEMSLVGPRPLLMEYLQEYDSEQARRHEVRPGITGWAQVNGRNDLDWDERFRMDVWYVDHQCFSLDIKILVRTFMTVLSRRGVTAKGHATMPPFRRVETVEH
ncbi:putative sugar transferase EpsL [Stieleria neptunia]|uniref:Putative sugar transferase EpsL n=1 Tax=Stieleria neptunia TaxID=2527979 RepID=A0A518HN58_9BACT|nr:sugar transferase [Stieleria neptunia]QDV42294.1 putative sugar transferase EpsL [Stieleria neptunia]